MATNTDPRTRKVIRWQGFDYGGNTAYLVTYCTADRRHVLGAVNASGQLTLTDAGQLVADLWRDELPDRFPTVHLHALAVMPDHVHVVLVIVGEDGKGRGMLSRVVGAMKSLSAVQVNRQGGTPAAPVWQARFHDRVLRDDDEFAHACWYVEDNPRRWAGSDRVRT